MTKYDKEGARYEAGCRLAYYLAMMESSENQDKFEYLYHQYQRQMYHNAKLILKDAFLAEDAVLEAFCKIAGNMDKIGDIASRETRNFVMTVTRRTVIDAYRKRKQYFEKEVYKPENEEDENSDFLESCGSVVEIPELEDLEDSEVGKALRKLPGDYRNIVLLRAVLGLDNREISRLTGFTISKIEKALSRSKIKLMALLAGNKWNDE